MPISALSLALTNDEHAAEALDALRQHPNVQLGAHVDRRVAAVLDTPDEQTNKRSWSWLNALPGIAFVHVLFVHLDPPSEE